jgi:putative ABC transport system ATP-binding protein
MNSGTLVRGAVWEQRRWVLPASVAAVIHQGCEAAVPSMVGVVVQEAIGRPNVAVLCWSLLGLAVVFAVLTSSMRLGGRMVRHSTQGAAHNLRMRITRRVLHPRGIGRGKIRSGELLSTATSDAQRVGMVNAGVWMASGAVGAVVVSAVLLLRASLALGLLVLIGLVPVLLLTTLISKPLVRRSAAEQAAAATAAGVATDLVSGIRILSGLGAEAVASARYAVASASSRSAAIRSAAMAAIRAGVITALTGGFLALIAFVGGNLVATGSISVGEFVAAIGLTQFLIGPFSRLAGVGTTFARASASARRIADVLDAPFVVTGGEATVDDAQRVGLELRDVSYQDLHAMNLTVSPGEVLGIAAPDPATANALLALLSRHADPEHGEIRCNGIACTAMDPELVRGFMLVSGQEAVLFSGTVRENITAVSSTEDRAVLAAADVEQLGEILPKGLDTLVSERGRSLSGGQRQRVVLARALAAQPPILVLHDPTTAVDAVTEARIAAGIRRVRTGKTTILVTTSPALLAAANRVVLLEQGTIIDSGTHTELMRTEPRYATAVLG